MCNSVHHQGEDVLQTPISDSPRQEIGVDLFVFDGEDYLVVADYYSRFLELKQLTTTTQKSVIEALHQILGRFRIPEVVRSDNELQFTSAEIKHFTKEWGINTNVLCHILKSYRIFAHPFKTTAVMRMPVSKDVHELQSFWA